MTLDEYLEKFPDAQVASKAIIERARMADEVQGIRERRHPPSPDALSIDFAGVRMPMNSDVATTDCLKLPRSYLIPEHGELAADVAEAAIILKGRSPLWIHGPPGCGKDAFVHAFSYMTHTPAVALQIDPNTNIKSWFHRRAFGRHGKTYDEEGRLLKALRDGYTTMTGRRIPYLILISDFDRADPDQMEGLRSCIESIGGRVQGAKGEFYDVLEGTRFVFTANSVGGGDEFGRCITSKPVDASFMDRLSAIRFHWLAWKDEEKILRDKFPLFCDRLGNWMNKIKDVTKTLREKINNEEIDIEFSHRSLEKWFSHAEKIIEFGNHSDLPRKVISRGARVGFLDSIKDRATLEEVVTILRTSIPEDK